ncbi:hypothetical protein PDESU_02022 [Pontiella desulfatans]|uniref:Tyrosine recombinase XerC n=1 Tax=Pontiella desulfatans TaxID=2750659 RepID=A0A6C2U0R8_PONDE|nr:site-specific integrase [Pontiella desulfatans]VGO13465.1 hypothetical protein PDESU_02022 [Pontiella desulfatans]
MKKASTKKKATYSERGTGRLYKRGKDGKEYSAGDPHSGIYYLEYRVNGKRTRQRLVDENGEPITDKDKAEKERSRITAPFITSNKTDQLHAVKAKLEAAEREHAQAVEDVNPPLTITDAWDAYTSSPERLDSGDDLLRRYCGYWKNFAKWVQAHKSEVKYLRDIPAKVALDYASHLSRKKISPNTYNKHTCFLKLFFNTLKDPALLESNPFEKIKSKKLKTEARRELSLEELQTVLNAATGELKTLLYIGTFTGLRLGDCSTLKWGEVDLNRGIIRRVPNKIKSHKAAPVTIGIAAVLHSRLSRTPKSKRKGYVVPKYAELYTYHNADGQCIRRSIIFRETQRHFEAQGIQTHKDGTGYRLEPNPDKPGEYIRVSTGKRAVVEVGFHSLRHTFVSLQAERGTPQAVVQAIVGHGNPAMTAHYTHIGEKAAKQAALAMPSDIGDAEFEELPSPIPKWAKEKLKAMTAENWEQIREELAQ